MQPHAPGARRDLEDLAELLAIELVPVMHLEQRLLLDREPAQRLDDPDPVRVARQAADRRGHDLGERGGQQVGPLAVAVPRAQVVVQLVARDREQVGAKARLLAKLMLRAQAREHRALDEVVGVLMALGLEEPAQLVEVAREQLLACGTIIGAPSIQELVVACHDQG
jgi:hypothetical protein